MLANTTREIFTTRRPVFSRPPPIKPTNYPFFWTNSRPRSTDRSVVYGREDLYPRSYPDERDDKTVYGTIITNERTNVARVDITIPIMIGVLFFLVSASVMIGLYYKCILMKRNAVVNHSYGRHVETTNPRVVSNKRENANRQSDVKDGCNLMKMFGSKSSKSEDTYEAVKTNESNSSKLKLTRQMSSSTIDAHTKVRDWIAQEIVHKCSPKFLRKSKHQTSTEHKTRKETKPVDVKDKPSLNSSKITGSTSTLGQSPTRPVSPDEGFKHQANASLIPVQKSHRKAEKISVAVDATPTGRGSSVMRQQPIELTKSLDHASFESELDVPLRRSVTLDNFLEPRSHLPLRKHPSNSSLKLQQPEGATVIKIEHGNGHKKSDSDGTAKKLRTFEPLSVNVTSRDDDEQPPPPLTPEESLQTIKRRNFPKVLPDLPDDVAKHGAPQKRRSMPAPGHLFVPIPENSSFSQPNSPTCKTFTKCPPEPPPRISSSLGRKPQVLIPSTALLAQEPPAPKEPELACNNLFIGPLIPSRENRKVIMKPVDTYKFNNQPIYDNLRPKHNPGRQADTSARRIEPKVIIKPTISRTISDPSRTKGPRVVVNDCLAGSAKPCDNGAVGRTAIPKLKQNSNTPANAEKEFSSESSENSDTGTVVKKT